MLTSNSINNILGLPELKIVKTYTAKRITRVFICEKIRKPENCPYCASSKNWVHQYVTVKIKDEPLRGKPVYLEIRKRRLRCCSCKKVFNEPIPGILKRSRFTHRFKRSLRWACKTFDSMTKVKKQYGCSNGTVYKHFYDHLEADVKAKLNYAWPKHVGIDEHLFKKHQGHNIFATLVVDHINKRPFELVEGKRVDDLKVDLHHIKGRENVKYVTTDLADPYKKFAKEFFPNAKVVADKFHVLRLLTPHLLRVRKEITGTRADAHARRLLTMSSKKLDFTKRRAIWKYLEKFPHLKELYFYKEAMHRFYRSKGTKRARASLNNMIDQMATSQLKEIKRLRGTLRKWKEEILNYFATRLTNARVEGFNNLAKLLKRKGFGFKSFRNYRLRVLNLAI